MRRGLKMTWTVLHGILVREGCPTRKDQGGWATRRTNWDLPLGARPMGFMGPRTLQFPLVPVEFHGDP